MWIHLIEMDYPFDMSPKLVHALPSDIKYNKTGIVLSYHSKIMYIQFCH